MREWPSIVPGSPGQDYHIVVCNFRDGPAFLETDLNCADFDTIVTNMIVGEYSEPLRVILLNPEARRCEDVSHAVAVEILRRLAIEGRELPERLEDFVDSHIGPDQQLTLQLAAPVATHG
jgi:hypothetical protein